MRSGVNELMVREDVVVKEAGGWEARLGEVLRGGLCFDSDAAN